MIVRFPVLVIPALPPKVPKGAAVRRFGVLVTVLVTVNLPFAVWAPKVAVMSDWPGALPVARPVCNPTEATRAPPTGTLAEVQSEDAVLSMVDLSLNVSIAVYCWVPVTDIEAVAGVTTNDTDVAAVTFKVAELDRLPKVALMVDWPMTLPVAKPLVGKAEETVATGAPPTGTLAEVQVEDAVLSMVVPSLNVSIAANCWVPLTGIEAAAGFTSNFVDVAAFTVNLPFAVWAPKVAVMSDWPTVLPVAKPLVGKAEETVATSAPPRGTLAEVQLEDAVLSMVDPSLNVSIAVYCLVPLTGIEAVAGITSNFVDVAAVTFKVAESDRPPKVAVMSDVPVAMPVAKPDVGLTVATLAVPEVQLEDAVTSMVDPSLYVAVALNCWVPLIGIEVIAGVTSMDISWPYGNQCPVSASPSPPPPPHPVMKNTLRTKINKR